MRGLFHRALRLAATSGAIAAISTTALAPAVVASAAHRPHQSDPTRVRPGQAWIVFQSLADQFDPAADGDGIDHDDTVFLVRPDGTGLHRLPPTRFVGSEIRPTWSPDG